MQSPRNIRINIIIASVYFVQPRWVEGIKSVYFALQQGLSAFRGHLSTVWWQTKYWYISLQKCLHYAVIQAQRVGCLLYDLIQSVYPLMPSKGRHSVYSLRGYVFLLLWLVFFLQSYQMYTLCSPPMRRYLQQLGTHVMKFLTTAQSFFSRCYAS